MAKKRNVIFKIVLFICATLIIYIGISYVTIFSGGISDDHNRWAEFGSLFASITGLLAFSGALWAIKESNKNHKESEERSNYFSMFQFFKETKNNITAHSSFAPKDLIRKIDLEEDRLKGQEVFDKMAEYSLMCLTEQFYKTIPEDLTVEKVFDFFNYKIQSEVQDNLRFKFEQISNERQSGHFVHHYSKDKDYLRLQSETVKTLFDYYVGNNIFYPIADSFKKTGNFLSLVYRNYLGDYLRYVYYILENFDNTDCDSIYPKLFRSQLSQEELILIFFNSFSSNSNEDARNRIIRYDLFNNMMFYQLGLVVSEETKKDLVKTLYKSIQ